MGEIVIVGLICPKKCGLLLIRYIETSDIVMYNVKACNILGRDRRTKDLGTISSYAQPRS